MKNNIRFMFALCICTGLYVNIFGDDEQKPASLATFKIEKTGDNPVLIALNSEIVERVVDPVNPLTRTTLFITFDDPNMVMAKCLKNPEHRDGCQKLYTVLHSALFEALKAKEEEIADLIADEFNVSADQASLSMAEIKSFLNKLVESNKNTDALKEIIEAKN